VPIAFQSTTETQNPSALKKHYLDSGRIAIADIGEELSTFSSSEVRRTIAQEGLTPWDETRPLWRSFVTTEIAKYIVEEQLYASHSRL
jgi:nicotinamide-nucleotide adenylyltransferase